MSDSAPPPPSYGGHPFPPPPPPSPDRKGMSGCLKWGLIGCGALIALVVLFVMATAIWFNRNQDELQETVGGAVQEGARFGLGSEEADCVGEGTAQAADAGWLTAGARVGAWMQGCLQFSRETPGFCEDVPPPTAIRRTIAWQRERCGDDGLCPSVMTVVQTYCTEGRTKRTAADTLDWAAAGGADTLAGDGF